MCFPLRLRRLTTASAILLALGSKVVVRVRETKKGNQYHSKPKEKQKVPRASVMPYTPKNTGNMSKTVYTN
eukprot:2384448-Amphidinium_carterae.1